MDPPRPRRVHLPLWPLLRMVILGALAAGCCIWALARHYTHVLPPMMVPVPDAGEQEIPVETWEGD